MGHHLAQINVARLRQPLDHEDTAEFVAGIDAINAVAEQTPGFVWRLTDESGQSSSYVTLPGVDDPLLIVNYSIWSDVESLKSFMFKTDHSGFLRRRREWFERPSQAVSAAWWIEAGQTPDVGEAYRRLEDLRANGPSERCWPLNHPLPEPTQA